MAWHWDWWPDRVWRFGFALPPGGGIEVYLGHRVLCIYREEDPA